MPKIIGMVLHAVNVGIMKAEKGKSPRPAAQPIYTNQPDPGNVYRRERPCFKKQGRWQPRQRLLQHEHTWMDMSLKTCELTHTIKM